jgi:hypothetical protein
MIGVRPVLRLLLLSSAIGISQCMHECDVSRMLVVWECAHLKFIRDIPRLQSLCSASCPAHRTCGGHAIIPIIPKIPSSGMRLAFHEASGNTLSVDREKPIR